MSARTNHLLAQLPNGAQAALIHNPSNMRYLSGYTGEGLLVISKNEQAIVTDFRYTEQAEQESLEYQVYETATARTHTFIAFERLKAAGVTCVALEEDYITYAQYKTIVEAMPGLHFVALDRTPEKLRRIKDESEIEKIARANAITSETFDYICTYIQPGMSEKQIAMGLEQRMMELGADGIAFSTIVASGPNGSLCHATPGSRTVQAGDLVTLDFGARFQGYCADMTRTLAIGEISEEQRHIYDTVWEAQKRALAAVRAGVACKDVDTVARTYIDQAGYEGRFGHGLGHSTGLDIHEEPRCNALCTDILEEGMTMTIEPGIYIPNLGGVRIEDSVLVTKEGCRVLTPATKELRVLPV